MFTRDDGERIARKLSATLERGRKHDVVVVRHENKRIGQYGLRRSSRDAGHNYIPRQLHISPAQCRELSDCPLSAEAYFELLKQKGVI